MKPEAVRKVICYHEAGHTVMAILLGQRIEYVLVDMEGNSHLYRPSAAYEARDGDIAAQVAGCEIDAKVALAGPFAQLESEPLTDRRWSGFCGATPAAWRSSRPSAGPRHG
jgi:hypothetical protein